MNQTNKKHQGIPALSWIQFILRGLFIIGIIAGWMYFLNVIMKAANGNEIKSKTVKR